MNSISSSFILSKISSQDISGNKSYGSSSTDTGTSEGVKMSRLFITHAISARLTTPLTKVVMGTREASHLR